MNNILTINTIKQNIALYLQSDDNLIDKIIIEETNNQAELLIIKIEELLKNNKLNYKNLAAVSTIVGPGSFIGLKTSIAFAKAIHSSIKTNLISLDYFDIITHGKYFDYSILKADFNNFYLKNKNSEYFYLNENETKEKIKENEIIITNNKELKEIFKELKIIVENDDYKKIIDLNYKKFKNKLFDNTLNALYIRPPKINKRK